MYKTILLALIAIQTINTTIENQSVNIYEIAATYDSEGYPTLKSLKDAIVEFNLTTLSADKISIQEIAGGCYSEKMYIVYIQENGDKTPIFFLKISKNPTSTCKLLDIKEGIIGETIIKISCCNDIDTKHFPHIVWLAHVFVYTNPHGIIKTIEITPAINELTIRDILNTEQESAIEDYAYATGKALAALHLLFIDYKNSQDASSWISVCHGDFNIKNIFFNPATRKIYLIDNEDMREDFIAQDLKAILMNFTLIKYLKDKYPDRWPLYITHCISFLQGYLESYPLDKKAAVAALIKKILITRINEVVHDKLYVSLAITGKEFNEEGFKTIIYNYLDDIINSENNNVVMY